MAPMGYSSEGSERKKNKRVVVIGGGVAGSLVAKTLQDQADVFLIDSKEYFEVPWANLRSLVEPSFAERSIINHNEYLPSAHIVVSTAVGITNDEVLIQEGHMIAYDYLVIATGHACFGERTRREKLNKYQSEHQKIKSSNSILVVGGGPTGVELAAEIVVDFPEKKVTLVHRGSRLLEFIGYKAGLKALNWLIAHKVEVILTQSVDLSCETTNGVYQTSGGERIVADCHFNCTGMPMGSKWLKDTILGPNLDIHGRLMVDDNLRVKGCKNIFGIGDITDISEIKQGFLAQRHALVVAKNLKMLMAGDDECKMSIYKPSWTLALVSLGRYEAVAQILFLTIIGYLPGMIKSRDLFVGKTRKQLGVKADICIAQSDR